MQTMEAGASAAPPWTPSLSRCWANTAGRTQPHDVPVGCGPTALWAIGPNRLSQNKKC